MTRPPAATPETAPAEHHPLLRHPLLILLLLTVVQTAFTLYSRDYWSFDETRHGEVLRSLVEDGHWFSLHMNGAPYPDKPPLYFWLAAGAGWLLSTDGPAAFFLVSAVGGFCLLAATWLLARRTLTTRSRRIAMLAALFLVVSPLFQLLLRTTRMDMLFSGTIVFAQIALWKGLRAERSNVWIWLGLTLAGVAVWIKGPVGLALPLAALIGFCAWTGRMRRLLAWDVAVGVATAAGLIVLWMVGIGLTEGWTYLHDTLQGQVVGRAFGKHKHAQPFWFYLAVIPAAWVPWSAFLATVEWRAWLGRDAWQARFARRRENPSGTTWLWACLLSGLLVLSLASSKLFIYALPLLSPLAVLCALRWFALASGDKRRVTRIAGVLSAACGVALVGLFLWKPFQEIEFEWPALLGPLVLVIGGGYAMLGRRRALSWLVAALFLGSLGVAAHYVPSFDAVMSSRAQAERLGAVARKGYAPLVYKIYPGTYSYYAGQVVPETRDVEALRRHLEVHPRAAIVTGHHRIAKHPDLLEGLEIAHEQLIEGSRYVLLLQHEARGAK